MRLKILKYTLFFLLLDAVVGPAVLSAGNQKIGMLTLIDRTLGAGYKLIESSEEFVLLPLRTTWQSASAYRFHPITKQLSELWQLPKRSRLICARAERAYFESTGGLFKIDLIQGSAPQRLATDQIVSIDCDHVSNDDSIVNCPVDRQIAQFRLTSATRLDICRLGDRNLRFVMQTSNRRTDLGRFQRRPTDQEDTFSVSFSPVRETFYLHNSHPTEHRAGAFNIEGWIRPFRSLPNGTWLDQRLGFGAPRTTIRLIQDAGPTVIETDLGSVFIHSRGVEQEISDVVLGSTLVAADSQRVIFLRAGGRRSADEGTAVEQRLSLESVDLVTSE